MPTDCKLMTKRQDIVDQILGCEIEFKDEVEMKLTDDEKMAHTNACFNHSKVSDSLKQCRGKIYPCC